MQMKKEAASHEQEKGSTITFIVPDAEDIQVDIPISFSCPISRTDMPEENICMSFVKH